MGEYINVVETFGCDVFNDSVMQARLPKKIYKELKKTIEEGKELSMEKDIRTLPLSIGAVIKASCFSAVTPVRGWNQWL